MVIEITELLTITGLSATISGVIVAIATYFLEIRKLKKTLKATQPYELEKLKTTYLYELEKLKDERKKEEINKKIGVYSTLIFYLSRMANNEHFKNNTEDAYKIRSTIKDIDELLKNQFYLISEDIFVKWLNLRSELKKIKPNQYVQNHSQIFSDVIDMGKRLIEEYSKSLYPEYEDIMGKPPQKISDNVFPKI